MALPKRSLGVVSCSLMFALLALGSAAQLQEVIWVDDFTPCGNGEQNCVNGGLRTSNWNFNYGPGADTVTAAQGATKLECYQSGTDVLRVDTKPWDRSDGILKITVIKTDKPFTCYNSKGVAMSYNNYYKSAGLNTGRKQNFKWQGDLWNYRSVFVEASMRLPDGGKGLWTSFWMRPQGQQPYGAWPKDGELDLLEGINDQSKAFQTAHFVDINGNHEHIGLYGQPATPTWKFHTYGVEWSPRYIRFYVDGTTTQTINANDWNAWYTAHGFGQAAPFDVPFQIFIAVAIGGGWPGQPDGTTKLPTTLAVDWVRAGYGPWQKYSG